jgi:hypothetical protein
MPRRTPCHILRASSLILAAALCGCGFLIGTKPNADAPLPYADPISLPKGSDGWTAFNPSADSRIVYVSVAAGNDLSGQAYSPTDAVIGPDPFRPSGAVLPFKTYAAAREAVREGSPDWILFHRGETYAGLEIVPRSGRGASEFSLVSSYGSGALPVLDPSDGASLIVAGRDPLRYFAVASLDCYCPTHDPANYPAGTNPSEAASCIALITGRAPIRRGLFEGLRLRCFAGNVIETYDSGTIEGISLRRCVVIDDFSTLRSQGHSQGLFAGMVDGLFLEECVFDHNGWSRQDATAGVEDLPGEATMFNHNTYLADCRNVAFKDNVFLRSSSIQNKFTANYGEASSSNISVSGNLYVDGEIGLSIGGNTDGPYRFKDVSVTGNVFTEIGRSMPTNRGLAWYLEASDWDGGEISGNYMVHNTSASVTNTFGIGLSGGCRDVLVARNVVYGLNELGTEAGGGGMSLLLDDDPEKENVIVMDNLFQEPFGPYFMAECAGSRLPALTFRNNRYFVPAADRAFEIAQERLGIARWRMASGDNSGFGETSFADPSRSVSNYQASLGGAGGIDGFIAACRGQSRDAWDPRYSAQAANAWIIAGFASR